jgi:hypothetical protein
LKKVDTVISTDSKINQLCKNKFSILITIGFFIMTYYLAFFHNQIWGGFDVDGIHYLNFGRTILEGNGIDVKVLNGQVGGPVLFAFLETIIPDSFSTMKIIAVLSGTGIVLLSFFITKNIFNYKIAILTQLFIAFNPMLHYISIQALNELLPVFLIFASLYFVTKKELGFFDYTIIGILLGIASLFRLQAIFVLFPILVFILLRNKKTIKNILNILIILIFFSLVFSPQILYNFSTHGVFSDAGTHYYIGNLYVFQNPDWHNEVISQNTSLYSMITLDFNLFLENYFYNLSVHNLDKLFNFGINSYESLSIISLIPFLGLVFFLGGLGYVIYNKQIFPKNFLPLLFLPLFYFPLISIIPTYRAVHLLPMWLPIIIISTLFIIYVIPKGFSLKQNSLIKTSFNKNQKFHLSSVIIIIIILALNSGYTYKVIDASIYGNQISNLENEFANIFQSRLISDNPSYDIILISEILKTQSGIEESYIMASEPSISFYSNSNYIYAVFSEGNSDDTILDYISRKNWSNSELFESNIHSFPPDRLNKYHPFPDYLIYQPIFRYSDTLWYDNGVATEKLDILLDPNDPRIPTNFEFLFKSDKTQTVLYKIHEPKN